VTTFGGYTILVFSRLFRWGTLNLAIPPWEDAMSIGNGFSHRWERNGDFCIVAYPATRTAGIVQA